MLANYGRLVPENSRLGGVVQLGSLSLLFLALVRFSDAYCIPRKMHIFVARNRTPCNQHTSDGSTDTSAIYTAADTGLHLQQ